MWKDGEIACVEVKPNLGELRPNQIVILKALAKFGIPCFSWRPKQGFEKITSDGLEQAIRCASL
jgi:hypothetical protein